MKIQMTRGCIANSLTVDGKEEIDLSDDEPCETCGDLGAFGTDFNFRYRHAHHHMKYPYTRFLSRLTRHIYISIFFFNSC